MASSRSRDKDRLGTGGRLVISSTFSEIFPPLNGDGHGPLSKPRIPGCKPAYIRHSRKRVHGSYIYQPPRGTCNHCDYRECRRRRRRAYLEPRCIDHFFPLPLAASIPVLNTRASQPYSSNVTSTPYLRDVRARAPQLLPRPFVSIIAGFNVDCLGGWCGWASGVLSVSRINAIAAG